MGESYTYIKNVRIVDGTGAPAIEDGLVVFKNISGTFNQDVVEYVGPMDAALVARGEADPTANVMSCPGHTILPGLINTHVHLDLRLPFEYHGADLYGPAYRGLIAYRRCAEALECGVTSLRVTGMADYCDVACRNAINKNMLGGPNVCTCGPVITCHGGHGYHDHGTVQCSGVPAFREATRIAITHGVDQIKLCYTGGLAGASEGLFDKQMTDDEVAAVIEIAHMAGKKVVAHLASDAATRRSVELGVDSVEHGYCLTRETTDFMAEHGTFYTPTLAVSAGYEYLIKHGSPKHQVEKGREAAKTHRQSVVNAIASGVTLCVGTDLLPSDPLDGTNATVREVELLVDAGLTPLEAIKAATLNGAKLCGMDHYTGSLAPGKYGDFIIVEGKPDENISDLRNLRLVAKHCRLAWGDLPGAKARRFNPLLAGYKPEGATFVRW